MTGKVPPYDEMKKIILAAGKDEDWIEKKAAELDKEYGGIPDPALRLWLVAAGSNIDVPEIKATKGGSSQGHPIQLAELTDELLIEQEAIEDLKDKASYMVEGVVTRIEHGTTRSDKEKILVHINDGSGTAKVVFYENAFDIFAETKIKIGDWASFPLVTIQAWEKEKRYQRKGRPKMSCYLSVPPFEDYVITLGGRDPRDVYKNLDEDVPQEGDPVYVEAFVTAIDEQDFEKCNDCGKGVWKQDPDAHSDCKDDRATETNYSVTAVSKQGSMVSVKIYSGGPEPEFTLRKKVYRLFGYWSRNQKLVLQYYIEVPKEGEDAPARKATPAKKTAPAAKPKAAPAKKPAPSKKKAPKPAPEPEPEPEEEEEPEDPEEPDETEEAEAEDEPEEAEETEEAAVEAGDSEIPEEALTLIYKLTTSMGRNRVNLLVANLVDHGLVEVPKAHQKAPADIQTDILYGEARKVVLKAVEEGLLAYDDDAEKYVVWAGDQEEEEE